MSSPRRRWAWACAWALAAVTMAGVVSVGSAAPAPAPAPAHAPAPVAVQDMVSDLGLLRRRGIDPNAVPNVIVSGVAKGGSTDIWNLMEVFDEDFVARAAPGTKNPPLDLEKEFNIPFISGDYIQHKREYPCPAETLQMIMRCPRSIMRSSTDEHGGRNLTKCAQWLSATPPLPQFKDRVAPKYTVDAYPYLMRNNHGDMKNILLLNSNNSACKFHGKRTPLLISLVRDPYDRVVSYYNYFILRSAAIPLEAMLDDELRVFESSPKVVSLLRALEAVNFTQAGVVGGAPQAVTVREAHFITRTYERLRFEMKTALAFEKTKNPGKNFEAEGILLDNIYLPQILGLLFPVIPALNRGDGDDALSAHLASSNAGGGRFDNDFPLLLLQSELLFKNMRLVFEKVLVPYFYSDPAQRAAVLSREFASGASEKDIFINSRKGAYSPLCTLSKPMQCRVYSFYNRLNKAAAAVYFRLQQTGKIAVAPRIKGPDDVWWLRKIEGCFR